MRSFKLKSHNVFVQSQVGKVWSKTMKPTQTASADVTPLWKHARYLAIVWLFKAPGTPELLLLKSKDPLFFKYWTTGWPWPRLRLPTAVWMKACVHRACQGYLLRIGLGLRASLLGSRENGGLIPLRDPQVGGDRSLLLWSLWVMWLCLLHDTCMFETSGKVLRVCANALASSPPASKRSRWSPHFITLHGPAIFRGLHMLANTRHAHVGNLCFSAALAVLTEGTFAALL